MPRKARKLSSCGVYHIMIRGINRMTIFNDDADNLNFLHILDFCADEKFYHHGILPDGQPFASAREGL